MKRGLYTPLPLGEGLGEGPNTQTPQSNQNFYPLTDHIRPNKAVTIERFAITYPLPEVEEFIEHRSTLTASPVTGPRSSGRGRPGTSRGTGSWR